MLLFLNLQQFVEELPMTKSLKTSRHYLREIAAGQGIQKWTDLEALENSSTPPNINILFSLYDEGTLYVSKCTVVHLM